MTLSDFYAIEGLLIGLVGAYFLIRPFINRNKIYEEPIETNSGNARLSLYIDSDNKLKFAGRSPDTDSFTTWVDSTTTLTVNEWYHAKSI